MGVTKGTVSMGWGRRHIKQKVKLVEEKFGTGVLSCAHNRQVRREIVK